MNNNKIIALIIIALLFIGPYWRINDNSKYVIDGVKNHLSTLGEWKHASASTGLDGKITLSNLTFIPNGHNQGFQIRSMVIHANIWDVLLKSSRELTSNLPNVMTLSLNDITLNSNGTDLNQSIRVNNFWPVAANGLGALGCAEDEGHYSQDQWRQLFPQGLAFNVEFTYRKIDAFKIDFNFNVDTSNAWFTTWSGTAQRASDLPRITFDDVILETLYYYHADQGFNKRRNDLCAKAHRNSFAAYRLESANVLQQSLRAQVAKDMPEKLNNLYQRTLAADTEINAIIKLSEPKYITEVAAAPAADLLLKSKLELALGENDYTEVALKAIDHIDLNMELLRNQMEAQEKKAAEEAERNKPKELIRTVTHQIGGEKRRAKNLSNWADAVGQQVNIKTKRGRPVFGRLVSINGDVLTVTTRYMSGDATITIPRGDVLSVGLSR